MRKLLGLEVYKKGGKKSRKCANAIYACSQSVGNASLMETFFNTSRVTCDKIFWEKYFKIAYFSKLIVKKTVVGLFQPRVVAYSYKYRFFQQVDIVFIHSLDHLINTSEIYESGKIKSER